MENAGYPDFVAPDFVLDFVVVDEQPPEFDIAGILDALTRPGVVKETIR